MVFCIIPLNMEFMILPNGEGELMVIVQVKPVPFSDGVKIHSSGTGAPLENDTLLWIYDPTTTESTSIIPVPILVPCHLYVDPVYPGLTSNVHSVAVSVLIHGSHAVRSTKPATKWKTL